MILKRLSAIAYPLLAVRADQNWKAMTKYFPSRVSTGGGTKWIDDKEPDTWALPAEFVSDGRYRVDGSVGHHLTDQRAFDSQRRCAIPGKRQQPVGNSMAKVA
jgi:hypothetical protein